MAYPIPYIIVATFFGICAFFYEYLKEESTRKYISIAAIGVFYLFFAFRGYVYSDWIGYADTLENIEWGDIFSITNEKQAAVIHEPGFSLICCLCKAIYNEYAFLVIVITTIDTFLFLRFLKIFEVKNVAWVFMLFVPFSGLGLMFNLLRNQIAIFIFLNAIIYIKERKPLQYFGLCTLALCFHVSALFYYPLYFFFHKKLNRWVFLGIVIALFLFYISKISLVSTIIEILGIGGTLAEKATLYTESFTASRALSPTGTLEKLGLTLMLFLYYDEITEKFKGRVMLINALLAYFFMYYFLAEFRMLSERLSFLFIFCYWVLWIDIVKILEIPNNRRLLSGIIYLYCIYMLASNINTPIQQYDNLLFGGQTQKERRAILDKTFDRDGD